MFLRTLVITALLVSLSMVAHADQADTQSAISAGPHSITKNATIMRWNGDVLRQGSNGWTCLPDIPGDGGNNPCCSTARRGDSATTRPHTKDYFPRRLECLGDRSIHSTPGVAPHRSIA